MSENCFEFDLSNKNFKKETIEDFLSLSPFRNEILSLTPTTWFGI